jgi:hypothetical protein
LAQLFPHVVDLETKSGIVEGNLKKLHNCSTSLYMGHHLLREDFPIAMYTCCSTFNNL